MPRKMLVILIMMLVWGSVLGCLGCPLTLLIARAPTVVPTPTRTPKPTFTPTPAATDTPIPTNTPNMPPPTLPPTSIPTPTPIPQPEATVMIKALNVRSGPGTNYGRVGQAKEGERLKVIGRTEAGDWLKILTSDGREGWVATEFVSLNTDLGPVAIAQAPPTPTPVPATPTPLPTSTPPPQPTATPRPAYRYSLGRLGCTPNCGTSGAKGTIYTDRAGSGKVNGLYVKVWADGWEGAWSKQTYNGLWEILLGPGPRAGKWYAAVYSPDKKEQLSEIVTFETVFEPCEPNSKGCQWAEVDFVGNW